MVTALRSGQPPFPPAQPSLAADGVRFPDFARNLKAPEAGPRAGATAADVQPSAPAAVSAPRAAVETDPGRAMRPQRPGSLVDIRV